MARVLPAGITYFKARKRTPNKPRYQVRIMFQGKQYAAGAYDTLAEAKEAQKHYKRQALLGTFVPVRERNRIWKEQHAAEAQRRCTVAEYSRRWLTDLATGPQPRKQATLVSYSSTINHHIIPAFGGKQLADVSQENVDKLLALVAKESGTSAARNVAATLRTMFNHAVKNEAGGLTSVPFKVTVGRAPNRTNDEIPTPAEVGLIASNMPPELRIGPLLAATCALRPAEVLGLQRRDFHIEPDLATVTIARQWAQKQSPPDYAAPKYGSMRKVAIPAFLVPQLIHHLDTYVGPELSAPLFRSSTDPKRPIGTSTYRTRWVAAIEAAGTPPYVQHSLRHLGLTLLAVVGATSSEIMARGGHQNAEAASRYQHVIRGRDKELITALGNEWEKAGV